MLHLDRCRRTDLIVLFGVALVVRLFLFSSSISQIGSAGLLKATPDSQGYVAAARALVEGTGDYESAFLGWAPGYPCLLALHIALFGLNPVPVVLVQILLSCATCLLCYKLTIILTGSRLTAFLSGLLLSVSWTSVTLSCLLLSDTDFLFFLFLGLVAFLTGLARGHWRYFILTGVSFSAAILIRSIGQYWIVELLLIGLIVFIGDIGIRCLPNEQRRQRLRRAAGGVLIVLLTVIGWSYRNYRVDGIPAMSFAAAGGLANIATLTLARVERVPPDTIYHEWVKAYVEEHHQQGFSRADVFKVYMSESKKTLGRYPLEVLRTYARTVLDNVNEISYLTPVLVPQSAAAFDRTFFNTKQCRVNYYGLILTIAGGLVLAVRRNWTTLGILASSYLYFALMSGATIAQGSRIFMPGLAISAPLMAVLIAEGLEGIRRFGGRLSDRILK